MGVGSQIGEFAGGLIGEIDAMDNEAMIQYLLNQMRQRYEELPDAERLNVQNVGRSELSDVREDPRYKNAEDEALRRLMALSEGGMSESDKAKLEQAKLAGLDYERGVRGRDEALMKRRGMANSGALIASELAAQQGGIDRAYKGDLATSIAASDRAMRALEAGGDLATTLGSRDLNQKNLAAGANDRIAQFNAQRNDTGDLYNATLAQRNALTRNKGLDEAAMLQLMQENNNAEAVRRRWRGYGKQAGALGDSFGGSSSGGSFDLSALMGGGA